MSENAVGLFPRVRRFVSCLSGGSNNTAGAPGCGTQGPRTEQKRHEQGPTEVPVSNDAEGGARSAAPFSGLRHNPIDVSLTVPEPVSVIPGNPSQRTYVASWCNRPVHLHVLTFVKRPNPVAQLPGPASSHSAVAAALDAPPPVQANMLTQPDMIAVATEVEAALVQLIAEPSPQVLPVLACAKVTCRAHIGSPGDEQVTQRIVAEVHVVTPLVPGLVSLAQWLQERWPHCEVGADGAAAVSTGPTAGTGVGPGTEAGGGAGGAAASAAAGTGIGIGRFTAAAAAAGTAGPGSATVAAAGGTRLQPSTQLLPGKRPPGVTPTEAASGGDRRGDATLAGTAPGAAGLAALQPRVPLGASQPIAEGVRGKDVARGRASLSSGGASGRGSGGGDAPPTLSPSSHLAPAVFLSCFMCVAAPADPVSTAASSRGCATTTGWQTGAIADKPAAAVSEGRQTAPAGQAGEQASAAATAAPSAAPAGPRRLGAVNSNAATTAAAATARPPRLPPPAAPPRLPVMPLPEALEILICLAEAVRSLHRRGLTHGALSPTTIQVQLVVPPDAQPQLRPSASPGEAAAGSAPASQVQSQGAVALPRSGLGRGGPGGLETLPEQLERSQQSDDMETATAEARRAATAAAAVSASGASPRAEQTPQRVGLDAANAAAVDRLQRPSDGVQDSPAQPQPQPGGDYPLGQRQGAEGGGEGATSAPAAVHSQDGAGAGGGGQTSDAGADVDVSAKQHRLLPGGSDSSSAEVPAGLITAAGGVPAAAVIDPELLLARATAGDGDSGDITGFRAGSRGGVTAAREPSLDLGGAVAALAELTPEDIRRALDSPVLRTPSPEPHTPAATPNSGATLAAGDSPDMQSESAAGDANSDGPADGRAAPPPRLSQQTRSGGGSSTTAASAAATAAATAGLEPPLAPPVPTAPAASPQRPPSAPAARRRQPLPRSGIRPLLPLPALGPAVLQMQTWGRARPVALPRDHLLWCAPELLSTGGLALMPPLMPRRSGSGSATGAGRLGAGGLEPLDTSLGCRRLRGFGGGGTGGGSHHHHRHFGDGSYGGGSMGVQRRGRTPPALLMGPDPAIVGAGAGGVTPSCDVYSMGLLMWYMVSGQLPLQHLTTQEQVLRVKEMGALDEQLPFSKELPLSYIQLARRCWAPLPMQRPGITVVLAEMRALRAELLGQPRDGGHLLHGWDHHGFGSSMGDLTADSRLSFTLSLALSSRELQDDYSLVRPPLELAFGAAASGDGSAVAGDGSAVGGGAAAAGLALSSTPPPPPPLTAVLPPGLLTALTARQAGSGRRGSGGGSGLTDEDDYTDTDRFTDHIDTEPSMDTVQSSPTTVGTTGRAGAGTSSRLAAAASVAAATARSFRMFRAHGASLGRSGSLAGGQSRGGGGGGGGAAAAIAAGSGSLAMRQYLAANGSVGGGEQWAGNTVVVGSGAAKEGSTEGSNSPLSPSGKASRAGSGVATVPTTLAVPALGGGGVSGSGRMAGLVANASSSIGCLNGPCGNGSTSESD